MPFFQFRKNIGVQLCAAANMFSRLLADIALGITALCRLRAVYLNVEHRIVVRLLDTQIDQARNMAQLAQHLVRNLALAAISEPSNCMSIGAGSPKFRIWVTISDGRK